MKTREAELEDTRRLAERYAVIRRVLCEILEARVDVIGIPQLLAVLSV